MIKLINENFINIKCPQCKQLPLFNCIINNSNNLLIKYKCHKKDFVEISLNNFKNNLESFDCKICDEKGIIKCICGLFCKDDYLYHILISKHNLKDRIIKLDNKNEFKYYSIICDNKFEFKNNNNNKLSIDYYSNFLQFIFENIIKNNYLKEIQILYSIFYNSLYNLGKGFYNYINNLEMLINPIIYYFKENNIKCYDKNKNGEFNYIISKYSIKETNKNIQILNYKDNKKEIVKFI
jgi:hypothetical protein